MRAKFKKKGGNEPGIFLLFQSYTSRREVGSESNERSDERNEEERTETDDEDAGEEAVRWREGRRDGELGMKREMGSSLKREDGDSRKDRSQNRQQEDLEKGFKERHGFSC